MAIVIPDLFGAFQKGREYAIDRNWKDLTNYEAIEKARNENDLGALNLLERRVMFAPKMGMYMDNADMSARNNALGGAAFSGLMAKTQAQSELDVAKSIADRRLIPTVVNAYEKSAETAAGTANVESAIQQARNAIIGSKAKDIGGLRAEIEEAQLKYGAETAKNAYKNEIETNKIVQERLATILRQAKLSNSDLAILSEKLGVSIEFLQRLAGQVQSNTEYSDAVYQAQKTPKQREEESIGLVGDNGKPLLNQEVEDYYLTGLSNGVDKLGQMISPNQAVRALALLQSPENYDTLLKTKNLNEIAYVFANLGKIASGGVVGGNTSKTTIAPVKTTKTPANNANNANNAENTSAEVNTDPNFVNLFGRRIPNSEIDKYIIGQDQLGQVLLNRPVGTTANGIPYYIGGKTAVSPNQWYIGDANTQPFQLTSENWTSMQQGGVVPVLLTLPNNKFQQVLINPDLAQKAGIPSYQVLTIDKLNALLQAQGQ